MELSNKEKVVAVLKSLETGSTEPAGYINPDNYIQHNLAAPDGLAGFLATLQALPPGSATVNTVRVFQDGEYVFTHNEYTLFGPKISLDIKRFEGGQIVEHWDNMQETAGPNPSGRTMIDGETALKDLDKTEANKALVEKLLKEVLIAGDLEALPRYFEGDAYIQHNPRLPDRLSGLLETVRQWATQGITMQYDAIHKVLGEGNFVLAVSEGHFAGKHTSFYDLFRVENGKIAEHWDTLEEIPARAAWKNNNGKF